MAIMTGIICGDVVYRSISQTNNAEASNGQSNHVINENVEFGRYDADRTLTFMIQEQKKINVTINAQLGAGAITFYIMSPDKEVLYEKGGQKIEDHIQLDVYEGTWYWRIVCEEGEDGTYSISGIAE
ncbi:hypothetical protein [Alkaliphilus hydrothermalis]|uniref:DUF3244 domain-containing protein n=1 Tax=Alkaliphilus hydrothermalis TaxID=1482730 RepID=A0ABS2NLY1_9FIRM|nr:hypothetical protein [Alkaliphilus hydrothermalis]MBM7613949.1 hypothetical protein [Alkaliphilus hydrothermalis]